jgi:hypothetical protein
VAVNQATSVARQAGKVPAGLQRTLEGAAEASVDWREMLRRLWSDTIPADYSWMRPNRRHVWAGRVAAWLVEAVLRSINKPLSVTLIRSMPVIFPIVLPQALAYIASRSTYLELRSEGPGSQLVALRSAF